VRLKGLGAESTMKARVRLQVGVIGSFVQTNQLLKAIPSQLVKLSRFFTHRPRISFATGHRLLVLAGITNGAWTTLTALHFCSQFCETAKHCLLQFRFPTSHGLSIFSSRMESSTTSTGMNCIASQSTKFRFSQTFKLSPYHSCIQPLPYTYQYLLKLQRMCVNPPHACVRSSVRARPDVYRTSVSAYFPLLRRIPLPFYPKSSPSPSTPHSLHPAKEHVPRSRATA
jgi:hypothetical protein